MEELEYNIEQMQAKNEFSLYKFIEAITGSGDFNIAHDYYWIDDEGYYHSTNVEEDFMIPTAFEDLVKYCTESGYFEEK